MKALVWQNHRLVFTPDRPRPERTAGEALVRVRMAGICNTDLEITRGYLSFSGVPGHEFVGLVEACDTPDLLHQRVVGEINCACGECSYCLNGLGRHCPQRTVLGIAGRDGAFAEYVTLPEKNLHPVPDGVSDEEAVFCEPLAAAWEILEQINIPPRDEALLLGDGKLGLLIAQVLRATGCKLFVAGKHPDKLALLKQMGIKTVLKRELGNQKFDVTVEASGSPDGLKLALRHTRPRGTIVLKTTVAGEQPLNLAEVVIHEISLIGSRCGPFPAALRSLADRDVQTGALISAVYPLRRGPEAFARAAEPGALKVLLKAEETE